MKAEDRNVGVLNRRQVAGVLVALPFVAQRPAVAASTPLEEVTRLMQAQREAWNRGDIAGFCAPYAEDCIFLSPSGVTRGRQTVQDRYAKKYGAAKQTMGQLLFEVLDTRATATTVSLGMRWTLSWPAGGKAPATGLTLIVWQKQETGWRLMQDASM